MKKQSPFKKIKDATTRSWKKLTTTNKNKKVKTHTPKKFGMFQGVFTPTVLTILGVIMYLRLPWVVGNGGILGAVLIVLIAVGITLCTSLSMASMTTNIRIGSGGAFSIISQSLGLEIGGSIGIPLYFSQAFAVAMYVFGFREGFEFLLEKLSHDPQSLGNYSLLIDLATFGLVFLITRISTDFAFKIQYALMAIVFISIISIIGGLWSFDDGITYVGQDINNITWVGEFNENSFWIVFAVFFPAVTGIMAGANMSGELEDPRTSIPQGTLSGVILTGIIYLGLVFIAALMADSFTLNNDFNVFIDKAIIWQVVLLGLLGATLSSALSSFIGAPRILMALGESNILPKSKLFTKRDKKNEPVNAIFFTAIVVFLSLLMRDLNAIAPLITMFFMITYAMINVVVLIEQSLGLPSFRPTLKVPLIVPLLGSAGCFFVMFIINPTFSLVSLGIVVGFYGFLLRKELTSNTGDARSGLFTALAEWATKKSNELSPKKEARAWQPELLLPVESPKELRGAYRILYALTYPKGSIKVLGMKTGGEEKRLKNYLPDLMKTFNDAKISSSYTIIDGQNFGNVVSIGMQALRTAFFKPNTIFLKVNEEAEKKEDDFKMIIDQASENKWGVILYSPYETGLGIERTINVWLDYIPDNWEEKLDLGNNDLSLLTSLIVLKNWNGKLNIIKIRNDESHSEEFLKEELKRITTIARIPSNTSVFVVNKSSDMWTQVPQADLNILELPNLKDFSFKMLKEIPEKLRASCMFTVDSGDENALV